MKTGLMLLACSLTLAFASAEALAREARSSAKTSVNQSGGGGNRGANTGDNRGANTSGNRSANAQQNANTNTNRNTNVNKNTNVNSNRNVNVNSNRDVDIDVDDGYDHPWAAAATVGAAVAVTSAAIGSIAHSVPPTCQPVTVSGVNYSQCGNTWYQPQMQGTSVQYVVVAPPS